MPQCNVVEILQNLWRRSGNKSMRFTHVRRFVIGSRTMGHANPGLQSGRRRNGAALAAPSDQKKPSFFGL
jgi:hypothetical protein